MDSRAISPGVLLIMYEGLKVLPDLPFPDGRGHNLILLTLY